jgi:hypothetical protein
VDQAAQTSPSVRMNNKGRTGLAHMEDLDRHKLVALVAVSLCTGALIAVFSIALAML